jgi:uncharacterized membrane protein
MPPQVSEWSNLVLRWFHVFVAILWVGQTYYFTKLARALAEDGAPAWMAQSGEVYVAEKRGTQKLPPAKLLSIRWEALATWLSGFLLLGLLYYSNGMLLNDGAGIGMGAGVGIGIGLLLVGWTVYDLLWISPLGRSPAVAGVICYLLLVALAYGLVQVFSGRAAYIHIGSLLGTILTANLFMRILPAQRRLLAAAEQGQPPDAVLLARVKSRSRHNLLLVVPVVFLMISNHFPLATYGRSDNWLILSILVLVGALAAKLLYRI